MSLTPLNLTFKQQNQRLIRATFKKAFVVAKNVSLNTVDISFAENPQSVIRSIPIATQIDLSKVTLGQKCRVDCYGENNPADMVVSYTW